MPQGLNRPPLRLRYPTDPSLLILDELRSITLDMRSTIVDVRRTLARHGQHIADLHANTVTMRALTSVSSSNKWRVRLDYGTKIGLAILADDEEEENLWRERWVESYLSAGEEVPVLTATMLRGAVALYNSFPQKLLSLPVAELLPGWQERFDKNLAEVSGVLIENADGLEHEEEVVAAGGTKDKKWQARLSIRLGPLMDDFIALLGELVDRLDVEAGKIDEGREELQDSLEHLEAMVARFAAELYRRTHGNAPRRRR